MRPRSAILTVLSCLLLAGLVLAAAQQPPPPGRRTGRAASSSPGVTIELDRGAQAQARSSSPSPPSAAGQLGGRRRRGPGARGDGAARPRPLRLLRDPGPGRALRAELTGDVAEGPRALPLAPATRCCCWARLRGGRTGSCFEGRVLDLGSGQAVLAKRYRGAFDVSRRMAHTFADEVVLFLTGKPGIALSSIAFTSDRRRLKEIYLMDYDGVEPAQRHRPQLDLDVARLEPQRRSPSPTSPSSTASRASTWPTSRAAARSRW